MAKISSSTIDEVNNRCDIVSLIGEYTRLERKGNDYWGCCPFHNEKTPSFHVLPDKKMYHCFGCGVGGGTIKFYMEIEKLSFQDAVVALAKKNAVEIIYEGNTTFKEEPLNNKKDEQISLYTRVAGTYSFFLLKTKPGEFAYKYLKSRGITDEIIEKFQLGYSPADRNWLYNFLKEKNYSENFLGESGLFSKKYPKISFFSNRLMFPIWNRQGDVIAFGGRILQGEGPKYLNSSDMVQYKKGETLYAFHLAKQRIRTEKAVIFCEGYMDVIAYHQGGITNAVAPLGTALTEEQIKLVSSFVDTVYLSFDSDTAGQNATYKAILLCKKFNLTVRIIQLKEGKDPAEIIQNYGIDILTNSIKNAMLDSDYLLYIFSTTFNIATPEGKTKAALAFFPYIESLQSDMQKESCFELLSQHLGLKLESVLADFSNRESAKQRILNTQDNKSQKLEERIPKTLNVEQRVVIAVIANLEFYNLMRSSLSVDDFEDAIAKNLYIILEECYRENAVNYENILSKCNSVPVQNLIAQRVASGEFSGSREHVQKIIEDGILGIQCITLERKRKNLLNKMRLIKGNTLEERQQLDAMLTDKMALDYELLNKKEQING